MARSKKGVQKKEVCRAVADQRCVERSGSCRNKGPWCREIPARLSNICRNSPCSRALSPRRCWQPESASTSTGIAFKNVRLPTRLDDNELGYIFYADVVIAYGIFRGEMQGYARMRHISYSIAFNYETRGSRSR